VPVVSAPKTVQFAEPLVNISAPQTASPQQENQGVFDHISTIESYVRLILFNRMKIEDAEKKMSGIE
jgi:hypothetical protein